MIIILKASELGKHVDVAHLNAKGSLALANLIMVLSI